MAFENGIPCPKCGNLCQIPKGSFNIVWIFISLLCFLIGFYTELGTIVGIIGSVIVFVYYVSTSDKPIRCPKCDYTWRK